MKEGTSNFKKLMYEDYHFK